MQVKLKRHLFMKHRQFSAFQESADEFPLSAYCFSQIYWYVRDLQFFTINNDGRSNLRQTRGSEGFV